MRNRLLLLILLSLPLLAQGQTRILRDGGYEAPPESGDWSVATLGSGTCDVTETSGDLAITASGTDTNNACFVHQYVSSGDTQVIGRVASITGTAASTTKAGVMIANSTANTAAFCQVRWANALGYTTGNYSIADNQPDSGGIVGDQTFTLPAYIGINYDLSTQICQMYETETATPTPGTDFQGVPQPHTGYPIDMSTTYAAGFLVYSGHASNTATANIDNISFGSSLTLVDNASPTRTVIYNGDFESGAIQNRHSAVDGFYSCVLSSTCTGDGCLDDGEYHSSTTGCNGCSYDLDADAPRTDWDISVVKTATIITTDEGSPTESGAVSPISGTFMLDSKIYSTKNYSCLDCNGSNCGNPDKDKNRWDLSIMSNETSPEDPVDMGFKYQTDYWYGFSVYIPSNYSYSRDNLRVQLSQVDNQKEAGFTIELWDYTSTNDGNRFHASVYNDATGRNDYHIGSEQVSDVRGQWHSFVIHVRFDETSNGFFKVWKSTGDIVSGQCRGFPTNPDVNFSGAVGKTGGNLTRRVPRLRTYKPNWNRVGESPAQAGPIQILWDAIYYGEDATTDFEDVNPCMLSAGSEV